MTIIIDNRLICGLAVGVYMVFFNLMPIYLTSYISEEPHPVKYNAVSSQDSANQYPYIYQITETNKAETDLKAAEDRVKKLRIYSFVLLILLLISIALATWSYRLMKFKDQASKEIARINKEKDHFIGVVSHDLRSPLNSIMALSSLMVEDPNSSMKEISEYNAIILNSSKRMESLINNMLDANKIETGNTKLTLAPTSIKNAVGEIAESNSLLGDEKGITTSIKIEENLPEVIADYAAIQRVLENLISNAYKFSPKESTVHISATKVGDQVQVAVRDEGPGITEADRAKLFSKFEKLTALPTGNEKSTGLGLFIVKNLMAEMNGTILVESELNKGTIFKILFDIA